MPQAEQDRSRWNPNSVHIGRLHRAPSDGHFDLHLAAIEYELSASITIEREEDILSRKHWSERLKPYEHQIRNLITFCRRSPVALFADDVGLGKTISAGLVLNELQTRKKVRRALILCPKMLLHQWKEELAAKFGIHAAQGTGTELTEWLRHAVPVVITTYESARDRMAEIRAASFDMLILDEAHKLRNLHGTANPPGMARAVRESLANRDFKYVLMLTATPIQNRLWDMYSLIDCLSVAKGHQNPLGSSAEFLQRYVATGTTKARRLKPGTRDEFRRRVQEYMVRTSRGGANLSFPVRAVTPVQCRASHSEVRLQQLVGSALAGLNALTRTSLAEALMSSPRALIAQVRRMAASGTLNSTLLRQFEIEVGGVGGGCKVVRLHEILDEFRRQNPGHWRVIVFTRRLETVDLICDELQAKGIICGTIRGSGNATNQKSIQAFTEEPPRAHVLVSTDAGAVGLNLQVCNVVINYDLPWNPMVLEQRIGRVQRLGSKFKHIQVLNLTVKDSVEDLIVARLQSKLLVITETIGDIEAILESSDIDDDERFEDELRTLVARALMGQDVEAAMQKAQASIEEAKRVYDAARGLVEETVGGMGDMHHAVPAVPKLKSRPPRFDVPSFCRNAFLAEGAMLQDLPSQQVHVAVPGRAPWTATFDARDPDLLLPGMGPFGGSPIRLYEEGSRPFEGLLGEWRKRHSHRVLDRMEESREAIGPVLQRWVDTLGADLKVVRWNVGKETSRFQGELEVRATASVSHDRFEKLCTFRHQEGTDGSLATPDAATPAVEECAIGELVPDAEDRMTQAVTSDPDIREFIRFYDARRLEEVSNTGRSPAQQQEVGRRFETGLAAELVGARGARYLMVDLEAEFTDASGKHPYWATFQLVPLSGRFVEGPALEICQEIRKRVPADWLGTCSISGERLLQHFLETSAGNGTMAHTRHFGTCEASGRRFLRAELGLSAVSGKTLAKDLLVRSEVSGRFALADEMATCEFTGARVLPEELERSAVSGRSIRIDRVMASAKSGIRGHRSEFRKCEDTLAYILPDEGRCSDVSGRFVSTELLMESEKVSGRFGLKAETVRCVVTSKLLLKDEAVPSAVSHQWVDKDQAEYSDVSAQPACPGELVSCEITGARLLPEETGVSAVTGRRVDGRLLVASELSGEMAVAEELRVCEFSQKRILTSEGAESAISGKFSRIDEMVDSAISGLRGHRSELVQCSVTGDWLLPNEAGTSAVSGRILRPDQLKPSGKPPGRLGLEDEFVVCAATGRRLLRDEVGKSEISGKVMDLALLVPSGVGGRVAARDEMLVCEESGIFLLPDESDVCAITGKRVDRRLLVRSGISGRVAIRAHANECACTGVWGLSEEMEVSAVCQKPCRKDEMVASDVSRLRGHRSEMVICALSDSWLLPSEVGVSAVSGRRARLDLMLASGRNPDRLGFPEETDYCAETGKRLLRDELDFSAVSRKLVDKALLIPSSKSGRLALARELVSCEATEDRLLPDETGICAVTGKRATLDCLVVSEVSGRLGLPSVSSPCEFTGCRALTDELERSAVSGKLGRRDEMLPSAVSGLCGHRSELETCSVTGGRVLPSEIGVSTVSGRRARRDLLVTSEKNPARIGLADELATCSVSGKRLLADEVVHSEVSNRPVDPELAGRSSISQRVALPEEFISCEETGCRILPDESGICAITGKRVEQRLLRTSDVSGLQGLARLMQLCPETGKAAFPDELFPCAVTGQRVVSSTLRSCSVTGEAVLERLMIQCAITGRWLRRDQSQASEKSGRLGHPDTVHRCPWTDLALLSDEVQSCSVSGLEVEASLLGPSGLAAPLARLFSEGTPVDAADPVTNRLKATLVSAGFKVRTLAFERGPNLNTVAYFADCSGLFHWKKRFVVGFVKDGAALELLHSPCVGRIENEQWIPEVS